MIRTGGSCMESGVVIARTASFCFAFSRGSNCSSHCLCKRRPQRLKTEALTIHCQAEIKWGKISKALKKLKSLYRAAVWIVSLRHMKQINKSSKTITCFNHKNLVFAINQLGFFLTYSQFTSSHLTIINLQSTHFRRRTYCTIPWQ